MLHPSRKPSYPHWDLVLSLLMLIALVVIISPAHANEYYQRPDDVGAGQLLVRDVQGYQSLPLLHSQFDVQVNGLVAQVQLQQQFRNDGTEWIEAEYVFPLPDTAAVNAMDIRIGERIIHGSVKEKEQAQREYVQARVEGKRAGLVEQQRANLFTTRVANIGPAETIQVDITFVMTLSYDQGVVGLRLPTTITPRYIPGSTTAASTTVLQGNGWGFATDQVPDAAAITPPQTRSVKTASHQAEIRIELDAGFDIAQMDSLYHSIAKQKKGKRYHIEPAGGAIPMDRDFVLQWQSVSQQMPVAAAFHETIKNSEHSLLMLLPPMDESALTIPPRELILIIDTSGSMAGESMSQARQALTVALQQLRPQDAFNVIEFNSIHRSLFNQIEMATPDHVQRALTFVNALQANGGTEMFPALEAAFNTEQQTEFLRQIVFMTDGSVGNETALFDLIGKRIGSARLYTVGIGSAPNQYFMRKAAEFGRGTFTLIGSGAEVQSHMQTLFDKIKRPVLTSVQMDAGAHCGDMYPQPVPDVFAGEPLLIHLRCEHRPASVIVSGDFQNKPWQTELQLSTDPVSSGGIATLWARAKVAHLQDEGMRVGDTQRFKPDIIQVGLDYQIVTPFTSFIAVEQAVARPATEKLHNQTIPNLMPQGSQQASPVVGYPRTALGLDMHWLLGVLAMLGAVLVWQRLALREESFLC